MPLPDSYDPSSAERKLTWVEWFQTSDPFLKATLTGVALGVGLGNGVNFVTKNKRLSSHVGWITYIASTAVLWLHFKKYNTRRLGSYDDEDK